jgi:hypothetical protein
MTAKTPTWGFLAQVEQAQGRVAMQANCTADTAMALMRERAALTDCTVGQIAELVNRHRIWFSS